MSKQQERILELQAQIKIAKDALTRIAAGHSNPDWVADHALTHMFPLDAKQALQGIVGHERRTR